MIKGHRLKRPSFQFYPADWRKDAALQSCSLAAQGLWVNMMCVAHECEPYGHLVINSRPMTGQQIARLVGLSAKDFAALFDELDAAGVASKTDEGAIYSRRMVRDEDVRAKRAAGGADGAEHGVKGAVHGSKGGRPKKARGVSEPPLNPPPSSSSSPSGNSEAAASDAAAAAAADPAKVVDPDPKAKTPEEMAKAELWRAAVSVLEEGGCPKSQCRTFMGRLVSDYTFPIVQQAVTAAVANQPVDAREYLKAACQRLKGERAFVVPEEPAWVTEKRERSEAFAGPAAARRPGTPQQPTEVIDATAPLALG